MAKRSTRQDAKPLPFSPEKVDPAVAALPLVPPVGPEDYRQGLWEHLQDLVRREGVENARVVVGNLLRQLDQEDLPQGAEVGLEGDQLAALLWRAGPVLALRAAPWSGQALKQVPNRFLKVAQKRSLANLLDGLQAQKQLGNL